MSTRRAAGAQTLTCVRASAAHSAPIGYRRAKVGPSDVAETVEPAMVRSVHCMKSAEDREKGYGPFSVEDLPDFLPAHRRRPLTAPGPPCLQVPPLIGHSSVGPASPGLKHSVYTGQ